MKMAPNTVTIKVKKGIQVNVEEVDDLTTLESRVKDDRNIFMELPEQLKVAVNRLPEDENITSVFTTMCG